MGRAVLNNPVTARARRSGWRDAFRYCVTGGVPRRCLIVALIVGTVLNLINQGDALLGGTAINWWKIALTYCVPYAVCTYGAVTSLLASLKRS
jgi:hypothetical protein